MGKGAAGESSVGKERGGRWRILGINNNITYASNGVGNLYVCVYGRAAELGNVYTEKEWLEEERSDLLLAVLLLICLPLHGEKSHSPMQMALPRSADRLFQCAKLPTTERPKAQPHR